MSHAGRSLRILMFYKFFCAEFWVFDGFFSFWGSARFFLGFLEKNVKNCEKIRVLLILRDTTKHEKNTSAICTALLSRVASVPLRMGKNMFPLLS